MSTHYQHRATWLCLLAQKIWFLNVYNSPNWNWIDRWGNLGKLLTLMFIIFPLEKKYTSIKPDFYSCNCFGKNSHCFLLFSLVSLPSSECWHHWDFTTSFCGYRGDAFPVTAQHAAAAHSLNLSSALPKIYNANVGFSPEYKFSCTFLNMNFQSHLSLSKCVFLALNTLLKWG